MIGIKVSKGIAIGRPFLFHKKERILHQTKGTSYEEENKKVQEAFLQAQEQIRALQKTAIAKVGKEEGAIFEAHLMILQDPMLQQFIDKGLKNDFSASMAIQQAKEELIQLFESISDPYIRGRVVDIQDVTERLLRIILGEQEQDLSSIDEPVILIAEDLTPSETIGLSEQVKGIITETGGITSHAAILAKALELPAMVGCPGIMKKANKANILILDTIDEAILLDPTEDKIRQYTMKKIQYEKEKEKQMIYAKAKAITKDGRKMKIYANIGSLEEWEVAKKYGAEGIGLFRTEFLYMKGDHFPTEEEQFRVYKKIAQEGGEEIILRTLDIGGDKQLPYYTFPEELNPFLGNRAIRFTLSHLEVFKSQLKAVLRAAVYGNLKMMYPMISSIEELDQANEILEQCKQELKEQKIPYKQDLEVGIMVEIPSTVLSLDGFASKVDFFSIGTNDLCQYTLAVDRMNPLVSELYQPHHPAVLRLIKQVAEVGQQYGKMVGVCGEMAGDSLYTKWLIGAGIQELSMSAASIPKVKEVVINTTYEECKELVSKVQPLYKIKEIQEKLRQ